MVFYFMAVKPWVDDVTKVTCIEVRVNGNRKVNLDGVTSLTCLMNRPALPIQCISFKEETPSGSSSMNDGRLAPASPDETLGQTLARLKKEKELAKQQRRQSLSASHSSGKTRARRSSLGGSSSGAKTSERRASIKSQSREDTPVHLEETLGESLARMKRGECLDDSLQRRSFGGASYEYHASNKRNKNKKALRRSTTTDATPASIALNPIDDSGPEDEAASLRSYGSSKSSLSKLRGWKQKITTSITGNRPPSDFEMEFDHAAFFGVKDESGSELTESVNESEAETIEEEEETPEERKIIKPMKSCLKVKSQRESIHACRGRDFPKSNPPSPNKAPCRPSSGKPTKIVDVDEVADMRESMRLDASESTCFDDIASDFMKGFEDKVPGSPRTLTTCNSDVSEGSQRVGKLKWGPVHLREHAICLGDNPACSTGVPLTLDWRYEQIQPIDLDTFEDCRRGYRQEEGAVKTSASHRQALLLKLGYNAKQLASAVKAKEQDQKKRIETVARLKYMKFDEKFEKMVRVFPTGKSSSAKIPPVTPAVPAA